MTLSLSACAPVKTSGSASSERALLSPLPVLTGATLQAPVTPSFGVIAPGIGASPQVHFLSPVAVAARNHILYVVDAGRHQIFRYDPARLAMARFTDYPAASISGIAIAPDLSVYLADSGAQQILHFSWDGRPLPALRHEGALAKPVAVVADDATAQVFVADSLYNHVVVFSSLGRALTTLKSQESRSLEGMARGPDGLYLIDRLSRQVVVMGLDGVDRYTLGEDVLKDPHAIAVDRFNRVFVGDNFDNTIKIFEKGVLIATQGGSGATPGRFNRIGYLSIDLDTLYVADSLNARVQAFRIAPTTRQEPP